MVFLLLACQNPDDTGESEVIKESTDSESEIKPYPWSDNPDWWTDPGPIAPRMFPESVPGGIWDVRMATSTDGVNWEPDPRHIAYGFSSFDLLPTPDGLILTGVIQYIENDTVLLEQPSLLSLVTADLETWGSQRFRISDATRRWTVDGGLRIRPDGLFQAHWFGTDIEGDPATLPGEHEIYSGSWDGETLVEDGLIYSRELAADPSVCYRGDQEWLFFTYQGVTIRAAKGNGDGTFADTDLEYDFVNVPACVASDEDFRLYAQNRGGGGPPWVVHLNEDATFKSSAQLYTEEQDPFGYNSCTSPQVTFFKGKYVLFCAVMVFN